jgi:hemoglobin
MSHGRTKLVTEKKIPTLYEWAGGSEAIERWMVAFYVKVRKDDLLAPVFERMTGEHPKHVAAFVSEVFGGPRTNSAERGGHANMIRAHLNRHLDQEKRRRWMELLFQAADEVGIPEDPEFRSAIVGYVEWGSRLAVINSQPGAKAVENAPMPEWGWGEVRGPYDADS